jgi:protein-arginine kinase
VPQIQWYQNGRAVRPSQRYEARVTRDGYASLRIRTAFPEDRGHYTCCATNIAGRDACSAELFVEGLSSIDETSYVNPDTLRRIQRR